MSTIWALGCIENKHTLYRGRDCMKKFCETFREHAKNIVNFEKKKMLPLIHQELKPHRDAKVFYTCGKRIFKKLAKSKTVEKLEIIPIIQVNIDAPHILFVI